MKHAAIRDAVFRHSMTATAELAALEAEVSKLRDALTEQYECCWVEDCDGHWSARCGAAWTFIDGGPKENNMTYCHHCGGKLVAHPYSDPDEEKTTNREAVGNAERGGDTVAEQPAASRPKGEA